MLKFIEVHDRADRKLLVNVENICDVYPDIDFESAVVSYVNDKEIGVTESYDEIKQLIHDVGVLIHKPDPRLNLTTPLTMDDLREMIGEPVWNSNNGKWYLMLKVREDLDPVLAVMQDYDAKIEVFSPDELIKFPLYRMKQEAE